MLNRVCVQGYVQREIDLKVTSNRNAVGRFTLAVPRNFKNRDGKRYSDYVDCIAWGKRAETIAKYVHKDDVIIVDGEYRSGSYTDQQGQKHYTTEVSVDNFSFAGSARPTQIQQDQQQPVQASSQSQDNGQAPKQGEDPFKGASGDDATDITSDDLPF